MKSKSFLFAFTFVALAFAGCADTTTETPTTSTPAATTTPEASTPTPPPVTPTPEEPMGPMECHGDYVTENGTSTRLGLPELQFAVKEPDAADPCYAFVGPATATEGWNVFTLTQTAGSEFHIMPMYYIGNHTLPEALAALGAGETPDWAVPAGAVGGVTPHSAGSVAIDLDVGTYVYFCPIAEHHMKGMLGTLEVAASNETREAPVADATITLRDYAFDIPANVSANATIIKVVNNGTEPHEAPLVQLNEGANMTTFLAALEDPNATAPPPGALIGGANAFAPGQTVYLLVDLDAGTRYGFVCFVESASHEGAPHIALGMVNEFVAA